MTIIATRSPAAIARGLFVGSPKNVVQLGGFGSGVPGICPINVRVQSRGHAAKITTAPMVTLTSPRTNRDAVITRPLGPVLDRR